MRCVRRRGAIATHASGSSPLVLCCAVLLRCCDRFTEWVLSVSQSNQLRVSGPLFDVIEDATGAQAPAVTVNFNDSFITVFKEVRNLEWLKFKVPQTLMDLSDDVKHAYVGDARG